MRKKIEALKNHAHFRAYPCERDGIGVELDTINHDAASLVTLELINAAD